MTIRFSWRRLLAAAPVWALAGILLSAARGRAQDPLEERHHMENRYLFVIDTSAAMKARANGVEEAVIGLLNSDMAGELRKGDTIGVWTYNDHLETDFPKQVWSKQKKESIVEEVRGRLRELHYQKRSHLEKALPSINQVVAKSERVTVILIFDGSDTIKGTPFDKDINDLHKQYVRQFKAAHSPFVTVLAARHGAVFDYTINYPGTVVVPPTADPLPPPETNAPPPLAASAPPPPVIASPPAEPAPPPHRIEITLSGSNFAHKASAPPAAVAVVTPTPVLLPAVVSNAPPPPVAVPVAAAPVVVQAVNTNVASTEPAPAPPSAVATPPPAPIVAPPSNSVPLAPPPVPAAMPVIPAVVAVSTGQQAAMFVIAFSLLTIAVVLVLFLVRRSRGGHQPSLISQSIDRPK